MTTIGELFLNLGIKGTDKTIGSLQAVDNSMKSIGGTALEAKAAILGAIYALQHYVDSSDKLGTKLVNFQAVTGIGPDVVQRYQYAARQIVGANVDITQSLGKIQQQFTDAVFFNKVPEGIGLLGQKLGRSFGFDDFRKFSQNPVDFFKVVQQYFDKEKDKGLRNSVLGKVGIGVDLIPVFDAHGFDQKNLDKAPVLSGQTLKQLHDADIAWSNLSAKIQMVIGQLNARYGLELVKDISNLLPLVLELVKAFAELAETIKLMKLAKLSFEGWADIFKAVSTFIEIMIPRIEYLVKISEILKQKFVDGKPIEQQKLSKSEQNEQSKVSDSLARTMFGGLLMEILKDFLTESPQTKAGPLNFSPAGAQNPKEIQKNTININPSPTAPSTTPVPRVTTSTNQYNNSNQTANINNNYNFNGPQEANARQMALDLQEHINDAFRQSPATIWGS